MGMGKRLLAIMMVVLMIITLVPLGMFAFAEGETSHDISNLSDLKKIGTATDWDLSDDYTLTADIIAMTAEDKLEDWLVDTTNQEVAGALLGLENPAVYTELTDDQKNTLISSQGFSNDDNEMPAIPGTFTGTFDGANHKISGLEIVASDDGGYALFEASKGTIKDLTFENYNISFDTTGVSGIVAFAGLVAVNEGTISNVKFNNSTVTVTNDLKSSLVYVGGIAAITLSNSKINDCTFDGTINFKLSGGANAFSDVEKLASQDAAKIFIGGIVADSAISKADSFSGNISNVALESDFIGGENFTANKFYAKCDESGSDITPVLSSNSVKLLSEKADAPAGETAITDWSTNNYRAIKDANDRYYIQHVTCEHKNVEHHDKVDATCSKTGTKEYYYCSDCKNYYEGSTAPTISSKPTTLKALTIAKDPENHTDLTPITKKDATCKEVGYNIPEGETYYYCTACKNYYSDEAGTVAVSKNDIVIPKVAHDYQNYVYNNDATETKDGTETGTCIYCGAKKTRTKSGTKLASIKLTSKSSYKKNGSYLITSNPAKKSGITVSTFKENLDSYTYVVRDEKGNEVKSGVVKTGYTVEVKDQSKTKMTIVVLGDTNKDGVISSLDYVRVKNIILNKYSPDKITKLAADANSDGKISSLDYVRIKNIILKSK